MYCTCKGDKVIGMTYEEYVREEKLMWKRQVMIIEIVTNYKIKVSVKTEDTRQGLMELLDVINKGYIKPRENKCGEVELIDNYYTFVTK